MPIRYLPYLLINSLLFLALLKAVFKTKNNLKQGLKQVFQFNPFAIRFYHGKEDVKTLLRWFIVIASMTLIISIEGYFID